MCILAKSQCIKLALCFIYLAIAACDRSNVAASADVSIDLECPDPRPEMCTEEYRPVCALRDTGVRCITTPCPSTEWKTYGNACAACSDSDVIGYKLGECRD
jgi:hypothetical protein